MEDLISRETKGERFNRLKALLEESVEAKANEYVGNIELVLVEGSSKKDKNRLSGYTEHNKLVHFVGDEALIGKIVKVKIIESHTYSLIGELVNE